MTDDAAAALGSPELAGTLVNPRGLTKKMTTRTAGAELGGLVGSVAVSAASGGLYEGAPDVPPFGRVGYVAVSESDDNSTEDYFTKLGASAFAAWAARGVSLVAQTINPGNPTCASFASSVGDPDVLSFTPIR